MDKKQKMYSDMLKTMLKIRHFETFVKDLFAAGEMPGFVHLYLGQEAVATGVCQALNKDDYITSTHRGHGHIIAKGGDMKHMMAELYGKKTGYNKGKGGSMHIAFPELGILGANGIVGAGYPIANGAAFTAKYRKTGQVAVCFFGDGAVAQGAFHESLNIASAFRLPVVFVCENNIYGVGTRQSDVRGGNIVDLAFGYNIPGHVVDGNNVIAVYDTVTEAVSRARDGDGPSLLECQTYRWRTHFEGEPDTYRTPDEVKAWLDRDPIIQFKKVLIEELIMSEDEIDAIETGVVNQVEEAVEFARNSPFPEPQEALDDVWA